MHGGLLVFLLVFSTIHFTLFTQCCLQGLTAVGGGQSLHARSRKGTGKYFMSVYTHCRNLSNPKVKAKSVGVGKIIQGGWGARRHYIYKQSCKPNKLCRRLPQYAPTPTSWPLTFWPRKWWPSHMWCELPLCQFSSSYMPLCSRLRPDVRDRQTSDAHHCIMPLYPRGRGIITVHLGIRVRFSVSAYISQTR